MPDRTAPTIGFRGPYSPHFWKKGKLAGGATLITEVPDDPAACKFEYRAKLGGGGVTLRHTSFTTTAAESGIVSFDYRYEFYHAWFQVTAEFDVFAEVECGRQTLQVLRFVGPQSVGPKAFAGSVAIHVQKGMPFGFVLGGSNFDSDSQLNGVLTVTAFAAPIDPTELPTVAIAHDATPADPPPRKRRRLGG